MYRRCSAVPASPRMRGEWWELEATNDARVALRHEKREHAASHNNLRFLAQTLAGGSQGILRPMQSTFCPHRPSSPPPPDKFLFFNCFLPYNACIRLGSAVREVTVHEIGLLLLPCLALLQLKYVSRAVERIVRAGIPTTPVRIAARNQDAWQMRVLIVDDSEMIRVRIAKLLERIRGVQVVGQAIDGDHAIELASRLQPDLVVLDLMMRGTSGYDVLCHVKRVMPSIKVVILTNYADAYWHDKCRKAGADYFLDKSTQFDLLVSTCAGLAK